MTDLLTHVLAVYIGLTLYSWQVSTISTRYVPIAMAGAIIPDLAKINFVVSSGLIQSHLGLPFSWLPFHRLGGILLVAGGLALLFEKSTRRTVFRYLLYGSGSHLVLDALIKRANGTAPPYLYPLSWWRPPAGNVYLSSDVWPAALAIIAVLGIHIYRKFTTPQPE